MSVGAYVPEGALPSQVERNLELEPDILAEMQDEPTFDEHPPEIPSYVSEQPNAYKRKEHFEPESSDILSDMHDSALHEHHAPKHHAAHETESHHASYHHEHGREHHRHHHEEHKTPVHEAKFILKKITLDGKDIDEPHLMLMAQKFLGRKTSWKELDVLSKEITRFYRNQGWFLAQTTLPKQEIVKGVLNLHVAKGYVDKVIYKGEASVINDKVKSYMDNVTISRPLNKKTLERYILLLNDLPGIVATVTFDASHSHEEAATMIVEIAETPVNGSTSINNDGTKYMGPWQANTSLSLNNLLGQNEKVDLTAGAATEFKEMKFVQANYSQPLFSEGLKLNMEAQRIWTRPGNVLAPLHIEGLMTEGKMGVSFPWLRSRFENLSTEVNLKTIDMQNYTLATNAQQKDRLRMIEAYINYDFSDKYMGQNLIRVGLTKGFEGLGSMSNNYPSKTRPGGNVEFWKTNFLLMRNQALIDAWMLALSLQGQLAGSALLSSQRYGIGATFDRIYPASIYTGDSGFQAKAELNYTFYDLLKTQTLTPYTYWAYGMIHNRSPQSNENSESHIQGLALGLRSRILKNLDGYIELELPFNTSTPTQGIQNKVSMGLTLKY